MPENVAAHALYRHAAQAAWVGLCANLFLGAAKLVCGIVGGSFALVSDAVNSLGDSLTSVVLLAALWYARQPPDEEHPYGHTRAEAVAASNLALLIVISAIFVGWEAIARFGAAPGPAGLDALDRRRQRRNQGGPLPL